MATSTRSSASLWRRLYGAPAAHLLLMLAAFAFTAYTISVVGVRNLFTGGTWWQSIAVWFAVAIIAHDLILFPVYALADRLLARSRPKVTRRRDEDDDASASRRIIPLTNYLRLPTLAAGLLLVMFLPGIIEQGAVTFHAATGLTQTPYLTRWLLLTAGLYLASAAWYLVSAVRHHRHRAGPSDHDAGST